MPIAESVVKGSFVCLLFVGLTEEDLNRIAEMINENLYNHWFHKGFIKKFQLCITKQLDKTCFMR
jgi:hypothetical protein